MKHIDLTIRIAVGNADITPEAAAALVQRLLGIGVEDAAETLRDGECSLDEELADARLAEKLEFEVSPAVKPRVLILVEGGIADSVADEGVVVAKFDRDDYEDSPATYELPAKIFADLAKQVDVPVAAQ